MIESETSLAPMQHITYLVIFGPKPNINIPIISVLIDESVRVQVLDFYSLVGIAGFQNGIFVRAPLIRERIIG